MAKTEKGKINIKPAKKEFSVTISFNDGKSMPIEKSFKIPENANGKEAEVERERGVIIKVIIDGKIYEKEILPIQPNTRKNEHYIVNSVSIPEAISPYNFIPLNEKIVSIYSNKDEIPTFDKFHKDLYTGYIDINIEAKTPIYIRDTAERNAKDNKENSDFFSPAGRYRIPGSSIRGLIRNIVEIASYSKLNFIDGNRKFHFRSFMDKSLNLKDAYVDYMLKSNNNVIEYPKLKAGYLVKKGHNKYAIIPSFSKYKDKDCWFYRVEQKIVNEVIGNIDTKQFFYNIFFKPVESAINAHHDVKIKYAKVTQISKDNASGFIEGYVIRSGYVSGKHKDKTPAGKHLDWIIAKPQDNAKEIPVARNVIENYKNDINRSADSIDLLKSLNGKSKEVPCFYVTDNNNNENIISIGHTGMFRLAYKHELNYFVKQKYESNTIDIATAIFGNESDFASRVFFEDAYLNDNSKDKIQNNPVTPKILSEPKPTSFQIYLNQYKEDIRINQKGNMAGLRDYNSTDAVIRGYKLYWHKNINAQEYVETDSIAINEHSSQYTKIKPIKTGAKFSGRIRFENLSKVELGVLLFSLKLKENLCHKIGMGKPLGLGSIKITPSLTVFNIEKRYSELFDGWDTEPSKENISIDDYINSFDKYIREKIDEKDKKSLWDVDRIKELEIMLDFKNKPRNDETEYMAIKSDKNKKKKVFRDRGILPKPSELTLKEEKIQ
jgi:CRISPR-associated protein (TIGR03986 family)